jgi:hypothetical protein
MKYFLILIVSLAGAALIGCSFQNQQTGNPTQSQSDTCQWLQEKSNTITAMHNPLLMEGTIDSKILYCEQLYQNKNSYYNTSNCSYWPEGAWEKYLSEKNACFDEVDTMVAEYNSLVTEYNNVLSTVNYGSTQCQWVGSGRILVWPELGLLAPDVLNYAYSPLGCSGSEGRCYTPTPSPTFIPYSSPSPSPTSLPSLCPCPSPSPVSTTMPTVTTTPVPTPISTPTPTLTPSYSYYWTTGPWGDCSATCGGGVQQRPVMCIRNDIMQTVPDMFCPSDTKPATSQACNTEACPTPTPTPTQPTHQ